VGKYDARIPATVKMVIGEGKTKAKPLFKKYGCLGNHIGIFVA
jgi:hypothetical protein